MKKFLPLATISLIAATPAHAEVKAQSDTGFVVGHTAEVLAKPDDVWKRLISPKDWWNPQHSWFGRAEGLYIDAQAGGCFCETEQEKDADGELRISGSVEHMRVIFADPGKVLRMQGALGPLQSEAVLGTLTIAMEPLKDGAGTRLSFAYVVGGYMRYKASEIAPVVDKVIGEQFLGLIKPLGKIVPADPKAATGKEGEWSLDPATLEDNKSPAKPADAKPKPDVAPAPAPKPKDPVGEKPAAEKAKVVPVPPAVTKPATEKPQTPTDKPAAEKPAAAKPATDSTKPATAEKPKASAKDPQ